MCLGKLYYYTSKFDISRIKNGGAMERQVWSQITLILVMRWKMSENFVINGMSISNASLNLCANFVFQGFDGAMVGYQELITW